MMETASVFDHMHLGLFGIDFIAGVFSHGCYQVSRLYRGVTVEVPYFWVDEWEGDVRLDY